MTGSTCGLVPEAAHLATRGARHVTRLSRIEAFGLGVLQRDVQSCARGWQVPFDGGALVA